MISSDGWVDFCIHSPGIPDKIYSQKNSGKWITCHSIVGSYEFALSRFMGEDRLPNGRYTPNAAASVTFIIPKFGPPIQMYSLHDSTWTSGSREWNVNSNAYELEGGPPGNASEPPTASQLYWLHKLTWAIADWRGWVPKFKTDGTGTLREHRQNSATACPSDRYNGFFAEVDQTVKQLEDIKLALFAGSERPETSREDRLKYADFKLDEYAKGDKQSISDESRSAVVIARDLKKMLDDVPVTEFSDEEIDEMISAFEAGANSLRSYKEDRNEVADA